MVLSAGSWDLQRGSPIPTCHQLWNHGLWGHTAFQLETAQGLWVLVLICKMKRKLQLVLGEGFSQCGLVTSSISITQKVCSIQMPGLCPRPMESESLGVRLQPALQHVLQVTVTKMEV